MENKTNHKPERAKIFLGLAAIICQEGGMPVDILYNLLPSPDVPRDFKYLVEQMERRGWISTCHRTVRMKRESAKAFQVFCTPSFFYEVLKQLLTLIHLKPLDDMYARREYFVAARLLLQYVRDKWSDVSLDKKGQELFGQAVIAFASHAELSWYGNKRQPVAQIEDRTDVTLLNFLLELDICEKIKGHAYRLLGALYAEAFRYDNAHSYFKKAKEILGSNNAALWLSQVRMYLNLSLPAKAINAAYNAFLLYKEQGNDDENIGTCLTLAWLCGEYGSIADCKRWMSRARVLIGDRDIPANHLVNICFKVCEVLKHQDNTAMAKQILDDIELESILLYGGWSPMQAIVENLRFIVAEEADLGRESISHYQRYCEVNRYNYGPGNADIQVLYSLEQTFHATIGNSVTTALLSLKKEHLPADTGTLAPGVRFDRALANALTGLSAGEYGASRFHLEQARHIYEKEIKPDEKLLSAIAPVFQGDLPDIVLGKEALRGLSIFDISINIAESNFNAAKKMASEMMGKETNPVQKLQWKVQQGRIECAMGNHSEALKTFEETLNETPSSKRFEIAREVADYCKSYDLLYESIDYYEIALRPEAIIYGKNSEIAETLRLYAEVLDLCGMKGKGDALWQEALMLLQSMNDKDGEALLYFAWSKIKQDSEAEELLMKAINCWVPERTLYDEMLAKFWFYLSEVQTAQGKTEEAQISFQKAQDFYPTEHMLEEIDDEDDLF